VKISADHTVAVEITHHQLIHRFSVANLRLAIKISLADLKRYTISNYQPGMGNYRGWHHLEKKNLSPCERKGLLG
jgi:uncharacterized protein YfiM (DUF2279 family)